MTEDRPQDTDQDHGDRQLAERLRAVDPAADLPPMDPHALDRLLAATVRTGSGTGPDISWHGAPVLDLSARRRRRLATGLLGVAAAGAVVLTGTTLLGEGGTGGPGGEPAAVALQAPPADGPAALCAQLTPDLLAGNDLAVAGEVTSLEGGTVTLTVTEAYAGDLADGDTLTVPQGDPMEVVDGAAPVFTVGAGYLVAATDGFVAGCGTTAADTPELRSVYDQAFPR